MPAVWRAGCYCVHHKIVANSEYICANESKPNPGEGYAEYVGTKITKILDVDGVKFNIDSVEADICVE